MKKLTKYTDADLLQWGTRVLQIEAAAINNLSKQIDTSFVAACQLLLACSGRIILTGIGKSGHIAKKIAATFASTGSPAFFVHPAEAAHGDLGMIAANDLVIALSNSGETEEILSIIPLIKTKQVPLISLTGNSAATLAKCATVALEINIVQEACTLGLAPTASTTAALAMGDALAIAVLNAKGFTAQEFAFSHPGGKLGKRLLTKVQDIMRSGTALPKITVNDNISTAILEISTKCLGLTTIVAEKTSNKLLGVITDGDLRRIFQQHNNPLQLLAKQYMQTKCKTINSQQLAVDALKLMEQYKITALPVLDEQQNLSGAINLHDLFKAGIV